MIRNKTTIIIRQNTGERPSPVSLFKHLSFRWILLAAVIMFSTVSAYERSGENDDVRNIFTSISRGLATGNVSAFSKYITGQTYLSLSSTASGYYSPNQAFYILQDFLKALNPSSFRFSIIEPGGSPYATGVLQFETKNRKSSAQVYISLNKAGNNWYISQLTIK
ncbi:MAG: DUF4783 domain-containing protein [Ignavibacteriaceae bacterium]|nr:DUF4783 domain-containing protein [Ignavibacteriaceae bacterium]